MSANLKSDFKFFLEHQKELVKKYNGKYIAIKGGVVLGAYESELTAIQETAKKHKIGTFLVQYVEPGEESYTQTFHSRVAFA
ncbi:MAG: DUF5678 domain-containing protein [Verrucomicrobiae bacterium]